MPQPPHRLPDGALHTGEFDRADAPAQLAVLHLGPEGRCYGSMSVYHARTPDHLTVKNANVCTREHGKLWWGDLDVTVMVSELRALARALGATVYVLLERDARGETATDPRFDEARYETDGTDVDVIPTQSWANARADARLAAEARRPGRFFGQFVPGVAADIVWHLVGEDGEPRALSPAEARSVFESQGGTWTPQMDALTGDPEDAVEPTTLSAFVVSHPRIRGGEPVVRGTDLPVYLLADLAEHGVKEDVLLEDYPRVTAEALRDALAWARDFPKPLGPIPPAPRRRASADGMADHA